MIYKIRKNVDYVSLELVDEGDYSYILDNIHVGKSAMPFEEHITVKYGYNEDEIDDRGTDDFPCVSASIPAFNERAVSVLGKTLKKFGELLPIYGEEEVFYLYNVINFIDLIDKDNSILEYYENILIGIKKLVLKPYNTSTPEVFKLSGDSRGPIYANEAFKKEVESNDIRGIRFEPVYVTTLN